MNKKFQNIIRPGVRLYLLAMALFAAAALFFNVRLAAAEGAATVLLAIYALLNNRRRAKKVSSYVESLIYNAESATNNTLINFPLPMAVFSLDTGSVSWGNEPFWALCGRTRSTLDAGISTLLPGFGSQWILDGKSECPELFELNGRRYRVYGSMVRSGSEDEALHYLGMVYWMDVTDYEAVKAEYAASRPVEMIIAIDNYDDLMHPLTDRQRNTLRSELDGAIEKWTEGKGGMLRRYDRDRYLFIFEKRLLENIQKEQFSLIQDMHAVTSPGGIHATVSLGVGVDGANFAETLKFANLACEMALSRGGDQAVVKNKFTFEFFGGRGTETETRTRVRTRVLANSFQQLLNDASKVYVMGHRYADMDTVGAAAGIFCLARKAGKPCRLVLGEGPNASELLLEQLRELPDYAEGTILPEDAVLEADKDTLLVVVDTDRPEQTEWEPLLRACNRVAVIDHHRRAATYIEEPTFSLLEPSASSAAELVTELMAELLQPEDVSEQEADAVLAGIVLDTKSFTLRSGPHTFAAASFLSRCGAVPTRVKLLMQNDIEETMARYEILRRARIYKDVAVAAPNAPQSRVVASQAADELLNIHGVNASVVLYPTEQGGVDISARSIGSMNMQMLLEKLGGGGNHSAAGAQMKNISLHDAVEKLFAAIDEYRSTDIPELPEETEEE